VQDYGRPNFQSFRVANNGLNVSTQYQWTTFYTFEKRTYIILGIDSMSYVGISGDPNSGRDYLGDARAEEERYRVEQENDRRIAAEAAAREAARAAQPPHPLATSTFPDPNRRLFAGKSRRSKRSKKSKKSKKSKRSRRR
jgi:hypothetical protein